MATEITMPKLSDTMTEGLFAAWRKNVGDHIERGDIIAEVETDKAVMELEAFASGTLIKIMVHGGENVQVGTVLGLIGEAGEAADPVAPSEAAVPDTIPAPEAPLTEPPAALETPAELHTDVSSYAGVAHEKASPLVRRLAREQGVDLERVAGSGPDGRITQDDLAAFTGHAQAHSEPEALSVPPDATEPAAAPESAATTPMRRAIAATVVRSWQTIPHFSVAAEINMDACREIVSELKDRPATIGYNSLVIKACAVALQKFPLLRAGSPPSPDDVHISFAVSMPDGLLMPVIRGCQNLSVAGIEIEAARLADKCRAGRLTPDETTGGSFSVSNLGMYGVEWFTALIVPGQTGILAVGAVKERPAVRGGQLAVAATMRVTLTSDHRVIDGAYAASFLAELQAVLEKPVPLVMMCPS